MKFFFLLLATVTPISFIFGSYEKLAEKYKPYPSTIDEASDIAISWLTEEHKEILARSYEEKYLVPHHFGPRGIYHALPISGNQKLISNTDAYPKEIYYMIVDKVIEKLRTQQPEQERARITHFIEFTKRDNLITIPKGTWEEAEKSLNEYLSTQKELDSGLYTIEIRTRPGIEKQQIPAAFKELTLHRILEWLTRGFNYPAYFKGDRLIIEVGIHEFDRFRLRQKTVEELWDEASVVVCGRIEKVEAFRQEDGRLIGYVVRLHPEKLWKGEARETYEIFVEESSWEHSVKFEFLKDYIAFIGEGDTSLEKDKSIHFWLYSSPVDVGLSIKPGRIIDTTLEGDPKLLLFLETKEELKIEPGGGINSVTASPSLHDTP